MRNAAVVAAWELRRTVGRKGFLISTATVPVLLLIAVLVFVIFGDRIGAAAAEATTSEPSDGYGLIDDAGVLEGRDLPPGFTRFADELAAREALSQKDVDGYFVVDAGYMASGEVRFVAEDFGTFGEREGDARRAIRSVLLEALLEAHVAPDIAPRIQQPVALRATSMDGSPPQGFGAGMIFNSVVPYVAAILFMVVVFTSAGYLLEGVSEEKETRVIEVVLSSVTPDQLLLGKVAGQALAGLTQLLAWVLPALVLVPVLLAQFDDLGDLTFNLAVLPLALAYLLLGYLLFAAFYATVGSMTTTFKESQQLAAYLILPSIVPFMLSAFIQGDPDGTLAVVLSWIPITAPVGGLMRVAAGSQDTLSLAISVGILAACVPFALWISTRVFRIGLLIYGRRLRLGDFVRAVRG
ncbi:MAG: ABC transporter permease [Chloroflexi bacterium]|nr:ABC transporter permease [Chloroflexota bacterium]